MIVIAILVSFGLAQDRSLTSYEEWKARESERVALRKKVNQADQESTAWLRKAEIDLRNGKFDEAERKCYVGLRLYPEYAKGSITADGYCVLGKIEMKRGNFAKAIDDFQYSLKGGIPKAGVFTMSGPVDVEVRANMARSLLKINKIDLALKTVVDLVRDYQYYLHSLIGMDELPSVTDPRPRSVEATIRLLYAVMPESPSTPLYHRLEDMLYVQEKYPAILGIDFMLGREYWLKKDYAKARHYIQLGQKATGYIKSQLEILSQGVDFDEAKDKRVNTRS